MQVLVHATGTRNLAMDTMSSDLPGSFYGEQNEAWTGDAASVYESVLVLQISSHLHQLQLLKCFEPKEAPRAFCKLTA